MHTYKTLSRTSPLFRQEIANRGCEKENKNSFPELRLRIFCLICPVCPVDGYHIMVIMW